MSDEVDRWLEHIATDEAQLKRLRKKVREIDREEERDSGRQDGDEAVLREGSEASWREIEERKIREMEELEDLGDVTPRDRQNTLEAVRQLEEHSEEVLTEFGLYKKNKEMIREGFTKDAFLLESIKSLDWVETDSDKPFRFSGIAFVADEESDNKRFYPLEVSRRAIERANQNIGSMTVEMGHPKNESDTSPERIIGNMVEWELKDNNEVAFVGELNNTRLGLDAQELVKSRPLGAQALSLRAGGDLNKEQAPDGHRRKRVVDMHLLGLDLVKAGGFSKAKVTNFGESKVGEVKDGMMMVGTGVWLPEELAENGTDDEILSYLEENRIKLV